MSIFKIDTPTNIDSVSDAEILSMCAKGENVKSPKARLKMIKIIYKILGYDLSNDLLYALADETKEQFMIAPAGGGKTTSVSVKIALQKIYRNSNFTNSGKLSGDRILSLVYGTNNVKDMVSRHKQVIRQVNSLGIEDLQLDFELECKTMHSFCLYWLVKVYSVEAEMLNYTLIDNKAKTALLMSSITKTCKKYGIEKPPRSFTPNAVSELYNYITETLTTVEELRDSEKVVDLGVDYKIIDEVIKTYCKIKKMTRRYDYTDLLLRFRDLIRDNETVRTRIQKYYDYITADEIQDFTPIMMEILKSIVGEHTHLVCIGDDDQSIYAFRGADNNNALKFRDIFPNAKIHLLKSNRRCPSNVLELANRVVALNEDRFDKEIVGIKGEGDIHFKAYNDKIGQYLNIVKLVTGFSDVDRKDCVIGYREKYSSLVLSSLLYKSNIPFHVISGYGPFDFELFGHLISVLNALSSKNDKRKLLSLYKVLPVSRVEMEDVLSYNSADKTFTDGTHLMDISKIPFSAGRISNEMFKTVFSYLVWVSHNMEQLQVKEYVPRIMGLLKKYYWNFIMKDSSFPIELEEFCTTTCLNFFNRTLNYKEIYGFYLSEVSKLKRYNESKEGPCLSTFHSLKGLEYNNVILCDLAESIFPNYAGIDFRPYDEKSKQALKECENRLMYVALTRSKRSLYLYYSKSDPSYYVSLLMEPTHSHPEIQEDEKEVEVVLENTNVFKDIPQIEVSSSDIDFEVIAPVDSDILPSTKEHVDEDLGITVTAKEVKNTYSVDYRSNLMGALFRGNK